MNAAGIQSGLVGMAIFDSYMNGVIKANKARRQAIYQEACPAVAAACNAFENYLNVQQMVHTAQVAAVASYVLNPTGKSVTPVTMQEMAPFLALNILA